MTKDLDDPLPDGEIARRMERGIRRFLNTPPQPHGKNPKSPPTRRRKSARHQRGAFTRAIRGA